MKIKYQITDSESNRKNYPDLIGQVVDNPPPHANVTMVKERKNILDLAKGPKEIVAPEVFIKKCLNEKYEQKDIIKGLMSLYNLSIESANEIFKQVIIKSQGLHKNLDRLLENTSGSFVNWYKRSKIS